MLGATAVLAASLQGLAASSTDMSVAGAYCAFTCGLLAWGWHEISFFTGALTGPRPLPCPPDCHGWRRFGFALRACLYHELAIVVSAGAVWAATQGGANRVGFWTFMILWAMRQSAKLNVYFGVLNLNVEFLPATLAFLKSYLVRRPMNPLFPFSVTFAAIAAVRLVEQAAQAASPAAATGATFLSAILILGLVEHCFMMLPLPFAKLWNWSLQIRDAVVGGAGATRHAPTWSTRLDRPCDPQGLHDVLQRLAGGAFGPVDRVTGVVRAGSGWVQFYVANGRAGMADVAEGERPGAPAECRVMAFGRIADKAALQAAFAACSLPEAA
jgi:putative photosynthetic complex assembly protein 2